MTQAIDPEVPPWAVRPDWADWLVAEVEEDFRVTADGRTGWLDPHEGGQPDGSTYSVCSNPDKYRILDSRIEAWARVLVRLGLAEVTTSLPVGVWMAAPRPVDQIDRQWILTPSAPRGLTLRFARTLVDGKPFGIDVGIGAEGLGTVCLGSIPDCGCDACDHGSRPELEAIDDAVLCVARGGVVHAREDQRQATAGILSWHTTDHAPEAWLDADTPIPDGVQRWLGEPWLKR